MPIEQTQATNDEQTNYPTREFNVCYALEEAFRLTRIALTLADRQESLWVTNEALDLLQRIEPN